MACESGSAEALTGNPDRREKMVENQMEMAKRGQIWGQIGKKSWRQAFLLSLSFKFLKDQDGNFHHQLMTKM